MKTKRYLFTLDPQYLLENNKINKNYLNLFQKIKEKNHKIAFVSSESYYWMKQYLDKNNLVDFFIGNNGNLLADLQQRYITVFERINWEVFEFLKLFSLQHGLNYYVDTHDKTYHINVNKYVVNLNKKSRYGIEIDAINIDKHITRNTQILRIFFEKNSKIETSLPICLKDALGPTYKVELNSYGQYEIYHSNINKFRGIRYLSSSMGLNSYLHVAFVNNQSDINIVNNAHRSAAFENANPLIKQSVTDVFSSSNPEEVAKEIEQIFLLN